MKLILTISFFAVLGFVASAALGQNNTQAIRFDFYGDSIELAYAPSLSVDYQAPVSQESIQAFYNVVSRSGYASFIQKMLAYKEQYKLDDWLYFQLVRKTAQRISPKAENYERYTLYKWFMLTKSGYDATLKIGGGRLLLYVQSSENIFDIPYHIKNGKQYVCLNYHDYGANINFENEVFTEVNVQVPEATNGFSYKVTKIPDCKPQDYIVKELAFNYYNNDYYFKVKMNPQVQTIFANYPVVDYESCFNIPLSKETYASLIPMLQKSIKGLNQKDGIDYLMRFTRYAFLFEKDSDQFGKEKRLIPEQTLLFGQSDCEDRAALFYYLVKEIYAMPMIVLVYPAHVTIAVKFDKPVGKPILYNGIKYSVCEATPQAEDLQIGQLPPTLKKQSYEVAFEYNPGKKN